jgi:hypothetical protein
MPSNVGMLHGFNCGICLHFYHLKYPDRCLSLELNKSILLMKIHIYFSAVFLLISSFMLSKEQATNQPWHRHTVDNSSSGADGVRLADANNDGLMDITTGWEEGGFTKVYLHPGYEHVRKNWPSVIVGNTPSVEDAVFADLDEDGAMDVISSTEGKSRKVFINWAPRNPHYFLSANAWNSEVVPASEGVTQWMFAEPAQLDGKNGLDIIAGSKGSDGVVGWFESPENAREMAAWSWHPISEATWIMSIIMRDMDQDGDFDVLVSDRKPGSTNGVRWLENPGTEHLLRSSWTNHFIGAQELEVMFMDIADLDADGLEDVIACERTNQKIIIWKRLDKTGTQWKQFEIDIPDYVGSAKAVKVGDMDGDTFPDVVLSTNTNLDDAKNGIVWLKFNDNSSFRNVTWQHLSGTIGYKFDRLELVDLDGDGDLDVLTCEENYGPDSEGLGVIWYENPVR